MKFPHERITGEYLELPIHEFEHEVTLSDISLVGMSHAAEPQFYGQVREYLREQSARGAAIHYESTYMPSARTMSRYPAWVQNYAQRINKLFDSTDTEQARLKARGWVSQNDALPPEETWRLHDLNMAEVVSMFGRARSRIIASLVERDLAAYEEDKKATAIDGLLGFCFSALTKKVIVNRRNDVAIRAVDESRMDNPHQSFVLVWGADHIPGLANSLLGRGYNLRQTFWLTANKEQFNLQ